MTTPLTLSTGHRDDGTPVLIARGEIDLSNVDAFARALRRVITEAADPETTVTVDLSAVQYLDSGAIDALYTHARRIRVIANSLLMPVLKICGLTELATIEPAPAEGDH